MDNFDMQKELEEFDFTDAETWAKIQQAVEDMKAFEETDEWDQTDPVAGIEHSCKGYKIFFDKVFGEGKYDRIFKGKKSLKKHKEVYSQILMKAKEELTDSISFDEIKDKYRPNRAERRFQQKYNGRPNR